MEKKKKKKKNRRRRSEPSLQPTPVAAGRAPERGSARAPVQRSIHHRYGPGHEGVVDGLHLTESHGVSSFLEGEQVTCQGQGRALPKSRIGDVWSLQGGGLGYL